MPSAAEPPGERDGVLRVVISHPMRTWVDGLESLLSPRRDIEVVLGHTKPAWVHNAVISTPVDILLTHVAPPGHDLKATIAGLVAQNDRLGIVALTESRDPALLTAAMSAGIRGWVEPTTSPDHLVRVLHGVARGETWYPPALLTSVIESLLVDRESRDRTQTELSTLSARELEVLVCLARGMTRPEIAVELTLSPHTVRTHINNLLHKLDVHSVLAAVAMARQAGLLDSDDGSRRA
jgi:DNA-binding NarL/FixJ family response regulator